MLGRVWCDDELFTVGTLILEEVKYFRILYSIFNRTTVTQAQVQDSDVSKRRGKDTPKSTAAVY